MNEKVLKMLRKRSIEEQKQTGLPIKKIYNNLKSNWIKKPKNERLRNA